MPWLHVLSGVQSICFRVCALLSNWDYLYEWYSVALSSINDIFWSCRFHIICLHERSVVYQHKTDMFYTSRKHWISDHSYTIIAEGAQLICLVKRHSNEINVKWKLVKSVENKKYIHLKFSIFCWLPSDWFWEMAFENKMIMSKMDRLRRSPWGWLGEC